MLSAQVSDGWRTPPGRQQYMPVVLEAGPAGLTARPATRGGSGSHLVGGLAAADGFAVVGADVTEVRRGDTVGVMLVTP